MINNSPRAINGWREPIYRKFQEKMSSQRQKRKEERELQNYPKNFTCGVCKQVHPYNEGYNCPNEKQEKLKENIEDGDGSDAN